MRLLGPGGNRFHGKTLGERQVKSCFSMRGQLGYAAPRHPSQPALGEGIVRVFFLSVTHGTRAARPDGHSGADGRNSHNLGTGILTAATNLNSRETKLARTQAASDEGGRYETRQPEAIRADPGQRGAGPDRFSGGCAGTCVDAGDTEEARAARNAGEAVRGAAAAGRGAQARAKA